MFLMPGKLAMAGLALAGLSLAGCGSNETDTAAGPKRSKAAATVVVDGIQHRVSDQQGRPGSVRGGQS